MPRLSRSVWAEVRLAWEVSPRPGLAWLTAAGGGPWLVTEEAIRLRRRAEGWTKRGGLPSVAREAYRIADRAAACGLAGPELGPQLGPGGDKKAEAQPDIGEPAFAGWAEHAATLLRAALVVRHRAEWGMVRRLVHEALREASGMQGFEKAKIAKITAEVLRILQEGERRAWGLDAELMNMERMSDAELEAVAEGRVPR